MKNYIFSLAMLVLSIQTGFAQSLDILVFSKTAAYRHSNAINAGNTMFSTVATANGWDIDFTENSADFTKENLSQYEVIVWNNVSGNVLNLSEEEAFKSYINDGGGYVGIHNSANAETNWPWYVDLLGGATFLNHAAGNDQIQSVSIDTENNSDSITSHFEPSFTRTDEWYNFTSNPRPYVDMLLSIDESTLAGPNMGGDHPITWKHEYDGGRAFYTGFGHTVESFSESGVITMLKEAVKWAARDNNLIILDEFNGSTEAGAWGIQAPYDAYDGTFPFKTTNDAIEITGVLPGPNQHLVREGITIDASLPYTVETKFKILNYGGIRSFAVNFLQANQPASQRLNAWSLNLDLAGPVIKYMGFVNGSFDAIGIRKAPWAVQNQEYIYKIEVNRRLNGEFSPKWVTATISKPDGTLMDTFEVDYSKFRWQPSLNEPVKFGLNSHYASWIASDLKIFYSDKVPGKNEEPQQEPQEEPKLIAYWPFDGNADDFSGNHNHGTEYNNPSYPAAYLNNGLETNEAYVSVDSDPFDAAKFTLMAWIKPDNVSGSYRVIFEKDKLKSDWYGLYQVGNKLHVRWGFSGYTTATSVTLEANVFSHVAATFDGSSARIYVNGVLKHSAIGTSPKPSASKGELRIGIDGLGKEAFQGIIDEAKIFATALNQSTIQLEMDSSYQSGENTPDPVESPSEVSVTGVVLTPETISVKIDDMSTLSATVSPGNASNKNVIWTSENPSIAYANTTGVLTGVSAGTTNIKVTTVDGGYIDSTTVSVSEPTPKTPSVDTEISLNSISYQLATLKISSWDKINDDVIRKTADTRLAQAKYYLRIATANFNNNRKASGTHYINISTSLIKQFISSIEKGVNSNKISDVFSLSLINEAKSIISNINYLINGELPTPSPTPTPTTAPAPAPDINLDSISKQIDTLKITSLGQIGDNATRITADARLAQSKYYFNIGNANFKKGKKTAGINYLKISNSLINHFKSTLEKGLNKNKLSEAIAAPLLNEAKSINTNIKFIIDGSK